MVKQLRTIITAGLMMSGFAVQASDDDPSGILTIDRTVIGADELQFPNDDKVYPKVSDFEVINYVLMSGENGERWATVTIRNTADGNRKFDSDQMLALFANGQRRSPHHFKRVVKERQTVTVTLSFGISKFPLLEIYTRT